jgi:type I site-specific restriction endonuclease
LITANQNPEQLVRDQIDNSEFIRKGWVVQSKIQINLAANTGVAVCKYQTDIGPANYILFVHKKPVGVIEAKREEEFFVVSDFLKDFGTIVNKNFREWIFKKQAGTLKYSEQQVQWLRMIKDYIANSFHVDRDDFELDPFNKQGGLGKMWQLFGEEMDEIINELNESLVA